MCVLEEIFPPKRYSEFFPLAKISDKIIAEFCAFFWRKNCRRFFGTWFLFFRKTLQLTRGKGCHTRFLMRHKSQEITFGQNTPSRAPRVTLFFLTYHLSLTKAIIWGFRKANNFLEAFFAIRIIIIYMSKKNNPSTYFFFILNPHIWKLVIL